MRPVLLVALTMSAMWAQQHTGQPGTPAQAPAAPGSNGGVLHQPGRPPVTIPGQRGEFRHRREPVVVPYPVYVNPYGYGYGYVAPVAPLDREFFAPDTTVPQDPAVAVINPYYQPDVVNPVVRDYSNVPLPQTMPQPTLRKYENSSHPYGNGPDATRAADPNGLADDQPTIFLIAKKDHMILATIAYWVSGDTLSYVTVDGNMNRLSMDLVDRDFSKKLNDERHVAFKLPAAK